jgi:hypothetical protein
MTKFVKNFNSGTHNILLGPELKVYYLFSLTEKWNSPLEDC